MGFRSHERSHHEYFVNLGDRCRIKIDGEWHEGKVVGLGGAGHYCEVRSDSDGRIYDGNTSYPDFEKIFNDGW